METKKLAVVAAVLLTLTLTAGCFGPDEDPVTTDGNTETTPGETVEAGGTPQGEPVNDTAIAAGTTTAPSGGDGDEGNETEESEE